MSYCRWSSDNWLCDVYVYEDCSGGWTTHVAGRRLAEPLQNQLPSFPYAGATKDEWKEWFAAHKAQMEELEAAKYISINLEYAGESFNDPTLEALKERLTGLKELGYNIPGYVFETIDDEIKEDKCRKI